MVPCLICNDLRVRNLLDDDDDADDKKSFQIQELNSSAGRGCEGCIVLQKGLAFFSPPAGHEEVRVTFAIDFTWGGEIPMEKAIARHRKSFGVTIRWIADYGTFSARNIRKSRLEFFTTNGDVMHNDILCMPTISGNTASMKSASWVTEKLEFCMANHQACKPRDDLVLPTRLVFVGRRLNDNAYEDPSLVETHRMPSEPYVCLSHSWGGLTPLQTTKHDLAARMSGIKWSSFSKTFQDAIQFTRRLNIKYIWIDSLCIAREDEEDWANEVSRMYTYYRNSYLTIGATKSKDGRGGCFTEVSQDFVGHKIPGISLEGKTRDIYVRAEIDHLGEDPLSPHIGWPSNDGFPLLSRGWVYQERMMSSRFLHCGPQELFWECNEAFGCECSEVPSHEKLLKMVHSLAMKKKSFPEIWKRWQGVIEYFCELHLTVSTDRLPALAGLAREFMTVRNDRYLAGIWEGSLFQDMLWHNHEISATSRLNIAPTWSWASTDGQTSLEYVHKHWVDVQPLCKVLEIKCHNAFFDTGGVVSTGAIKLQCTVRSGPFRHADFEPLRAEKIFNDNGPWIELPKQYLTLNMDYNFMEGPHTIPAGTILHLIKFASFENEFGTLVQYFLVLRCINFEAQAYIRVGIHESVTSKTPRLHNGVEEERILTLV